MKVIDLGQPLILAQIDQIVVSVTTNSEYDLSTSGTTGLPKKVSKNLSNALSAKRNGHSSQSWLLAYSPMRWAGVSVVLHCIKFDCTLVIPKSQDSTGLLHALTETEHVSHLSLTPSMFKSLLVADTHKRLPNAHLSQITFGGEAISQSTLDSASALWPNARITHTYASTEQGDICSVSDGIEGFPTYKLDRFSFSPEGELSIGGIPTGDLWLKKDGRYIYGGRTSEIINVGGNKVNPQTVEDCAISCGAQLARCFGISSPILGFLVGLEYVGNISPEELQKSLRGKLPKFAWPRQLTQVERIHLSDAGKMRRL